MGRGASLENPGLVREPRTVQTPQVPPNPTVTFPPSTITGTSRLPPEWESIRAMFSREDFTLTYSKGTFRRAKSARAAEVYGQVSFPKISTGVGSIPTRVIARNGSVKHCYDLGQ
jgi:hypothetical protein